MLNLSISKLIISTTGNIVALSNPVFKLLPAISARLPTIAGLAVAPKSPAKAKNANIAVPPRGHAFVEMLIDPGHIMPTAKPQKAHPISPKTGNTAKDAKR